MQNNKLECLFGYHCFCKGIITDTGRWPSRYKVQWLCERCGIYTGLYNICGDFKAAQDLIKYKKENEKDVCINYKDIKTL